MDYKIAEKAAFTVMGVQVLNTIRAILKYHSSGLSIIRTGKGKTVCRMYGICIDEDKSTDSLIT